MLCQKCGFEIPRNHRDCPTCKPKNPKRRGRIEDPRQTPTAFKPSRRRGLLGRLTDWLLDLGIGQVIRLMKTKGYEIDASDEEMEELLQQLDRLHPTVRDKLVQRVAKTNPRFAQKACSILKNLPPEILAAVGEPIPTTHTHT